MLVNVWLGSVYCFRISHINCFEWIVYELPVPESAQSGRLVWRIQQLINNVSAVMFLTIIKHNNIKLWLMWREGKSAVLCFSCEMTIEYLHQKYLLKINRIIGFISVEVLWTVHYQLDHDEWINCVRASYPIIRRHIETITVQFIGKTARWWTKERG